MKYIPVKHAMAILGITSTYLYELMRRGRIRGHRVCTLVNLDDLERYEGTLLPRGRRQGHTRQPLDTRQVLVGELPEEGEV